MNRYFWRYWLPLHIIAAIMIVAAIYGSLEINWWLVLLSWILIGPIGNGVGSHKLFAHRQFETWRPIEVALGVLSTLGGFAPIHFWVAIHQKHHKISDTVGDPSSPSQHGFLQSFLIYRFRESVLKKTHIRNYCVKQILKDPVLMFLSKHFTKIIWSVIIVLASIDLNLLLNLFLIPVALEHVRTNLVSSLSHMKIPFSYRNYETNDNSQNNFILGYLTFGFSWHNNHHAHPRNSSCHEKWWEVDVEGIICRLLNKK